jgi:signal transduction histidine kinase
LHAQSETDSLKNLLNKAKEDTNKVHLYWKTGVSLIYQDAQASIPFFRKGAELATKIGFISGMERCYNATSLAFSVNAKYDSALTYINMAVKYAVQAGDIRRLALAYLNRADVHKNLQLYSAALKDCDTAIHYAEKANNSDALGRIYGIIANIYLDQKQYTTALTYLDRSQEIFAKIGNRRMVAQSNSDEADMYLHLGQPEKALPLLLFAIKVGDSLEDVENLAAYRISIAEAYIGLKQYDKAKEAALTALHTTEQTGNILQKATVQETLYKVEAAKNNMARAIEYLQEAFETFKQESDILREQSAAHNLSEAYVKINNHAQALHYLKISGDLNDSLTRQQFNREIASLQTTFEVGQKDKEIKLLNKEKELQDQRMQKQRLLLVAMGGLALLTITGTWLVINRNKLKQRMKELELRNRIAADLHDEVGSSLSSIRMLSEMAIKKANDAGQNDLLSMVSSNAKETMDKMGDIIWMIKPGDTEAGSLKQRMERFAYEIGTSMHLDISIQLAALDDTNLSMEQRKNIYLIFKEALNNAAKYSAAKRVEIETALRDSELHLRISDEGNGFDIDNVKKGNGLNNIRNRARELGAKLDIISAIKRGTTVHLRVRV